MTMAKPMDFVEENGNQVLNYVSENILIILISVAMVIGISYVLTNAVVRYFNVRGLYYPCFESVMIILILLVTDFKEFQALLDVPEVLENENETMLALITVFTSYILYSVTSFIVLFFLNKSWLDFEKKQSKGMANTTDKPIYRKQTYRKFLYLFGTLQLLFAGLHCFRFYFYDSDTSHYWFYSIVCLIYWLLLYCISENIFKNQTLSIKGNRKVYLDYTFKILAVLFLVHLFALPIFLMMNWAGNFLVYILFIQQAATFGYFCLRYRIRNQVL